LDLNPSVYTAQPLLYAADMNLGLVKVLPTETIAGSQDARPEGTLYIASVEALNWAPSHALARPLPVPRAAPLLNLMIVFESYISASVFR